MANSVTTAVFFAGHNHQFLSKIQIVGLNTLLRYH